MRNFRFSLEKILSWRRTELQSEEARLAALFAERNRLDAASVEIRAASERAATRIFAAEAVDGIELQSLNGYQRRLEKELISLDRRRAQSGVEILKQRARVVDAHRRVRLLEKLKDRRLGEWRVDWQRETDSLASESFLARWHRQ
jgi:flagellar export protein FliJ